MEYNEKIPTLKPSTDDIVFFVAQLPLSPMKSTTGLWLSGWLICNRSYNRDDRNICASNITLLHIGIETQSNSLPFPVLSLRLAGNFRSVLITSSLAESASSHNEEERAEDSNGAFQGRELDNDPQHPVTHQPHYPSNQEHLFLLLQQQQLQFIPQQFQQQFNQRQQQRFPQKTQQQQPHKSLASHFHLQHLVENLADVVENGTHDQQTYALVGNQLNNQFEKCQQLLNSISGTIKTKSTIVEEQKHKLGDTENLLKQQRLYPLA
ncbi:Mediator of RNA polymerase II transcription subunit 9 [Forsythia ovata]|uniref:Mediator of RNA polymerase II transcription subunit 9 n=1 Tax=Forsythia ovata TaxID=205694 RepID=A0ABD1TUG1_9LAMI